MELKWIQDFLMWCTLINGAVLLLWSLATMFLPDLVYESQRKWFPISRERYDAIMYTLIGVFKILFIIFNLTPLLVILIIH